MFSFRLNFYVNYGIRNFSGSVVLALVDKQGNIKEFISSQESVSGLQIGYGSGRIFSCTITETPEEGDRIWMMYKSQDGNEWKRIRGNKDTTTEIIVKESPTSVAENVDDPDTNLFAVANNAAQTVYIKSAQPILELSLVDMEGRIIKKAEGVGTADYTLPYSGYPDGTYIIQVVTSAGMSSTKVMLK